MWGHRVVRRSTSWESKMEGGGGLPSRPACLHSASSLVPPPPSGPLSPGWLGDRLGSRVPGILLSPSLPTQPAESIWEAAALWAKEGPRWALGLVPIAAVQLVAHALLWTRGQPSDRHVQLGAGGACAGR